MNILFFAGFPLQNAGGVGRVSLTLSQEFVRMGHRVIFLAGESGQEFVTGGIRQLFVPSANVRSKKNLTYLKRLLDKEAIDVILNQGGATPKLMDLVLSVRDRCLILSVHHNCVSCLLDSHRSIIDHTLDRYCVPGWLRPEAAYGFLRARSRRRTGRCFERLTKEGDRLVLLAPSYIPELADFSAEIDLKKVSAIPNASPFSPDPSALKEKENRILFVGRLANQQKRVDRVLKIWQKLSNEFLDWELDIVGEGPDQNQLERQAREMSLSRVTFHGAQNPVPFYRRSKVFLLTSDFEGFPMVLVESQAFGCIPVAANCFSAISDIVEHGKSGLVSEKPNIAHYVSHCRRLLKDINETDRLAAGALEKAAFLSAPRVANAWLKEIEGLSGIATVGDRRAAE